MIVFLVATINDGLYKGDNSYNNQYSSKESELLYQQVMC